MVPAYPGSVETTEQFQWRVPAKVPVAKLAVASILVAVGLVATGPWSLVVAVVPAVGLVAWAVHDLLVPVRLTADDAGLTVVRPFHGSHRLPWSRIERVRVDTRRRYRALEIDTGEELFLFGRYDVDSDLDDVAGLIEALRSAAR